ncbi:uncharacterized protein B0H18DRAFT_1011527, partial [Fomitopsis serialis]|uniref:uncharacterized protein n=1 Tax=Fomitopsis serialis TaxID=139415 RepID=UPI002007A52C
MRWPMRPCVAFVALVTACLIRSQELQCFVAHGTRQMSCGLSLLCALVTVRLPTHITEGHMSRWDSSNILFTTQLGVVRWPVSTRPVTLL